MIRYSTNPTIKAVEEKLESALCTFEGQMFIIRSQTKPFFEKYGKPTCYMGNLFASPIDSWEDYIAQSRKLKIDDRIPYLQKVLDSIVILPKTVFYIYPELHIAILNGKEYTFSHFISYSFFNHYRYGPLYVVERRSANFGPRLMNDVIYINNEDERIEAQELLDCILKGIKPKKSDKTPASTEYINDDEDGHPSFFGLSFSRSINQLMDGLYERGFRKSSSSKGIIYCNGKIEGVDFHCNFSFDKKTGIVYYMFGISEDIKGYDNLRQKYDRIVAYMKVVYGPFGLWKKDVPAGVRKNSIMKGLREDKFEISTTYKWLHVGHNPSHVSLSIMADDYDLKEGNIYINISDEINLDRLNPYRQKLLQKISNKINDPNEL